MDFNSSVDFGTVTAVPERKGYTFDGWQYLRKGATLDETGKYSPEDYKDVPKDGDSYVLKIDTELLNNAQFKTTDGVSARIYTPNGRRLRPISPWFFGQRIWMG